MGEPSTQHERPCIASEKSVDSILASAAPPARRGHRHRRSHGGWGACILRRSTAPVTRAVARMDQSPQIRHQNHAAAGDDWAGHSRNHRWRPDEQRLCVHSSSEQL